MRRRGIRVERLGLGFVAALLAGSSGLFFLRGLVPESWSGLHAAAGALSAGFPDAANGLLAVTGQGNPIIWSAVVPLALTMLLYGSRRLRPLVAGFGFGVAGALLFAAVTGTIGVRYLPDALDPIWLGANGLAAALVASVVIRKASA